MTSDKLKAIQIPKMTHIFGHVIGVTEYYLKSEADREFCNQKHKRCMAMADRCRERFHHYVVLVCFSPNKGAIPFYERKRDRAYKWMYKCREIADKLKEGV